MGTEFAKHIPDQFKGLEQKDQSPAQAIFKVLTLEDSQSSRSWDGKRDLKL